MFKKITRFVVIALTLSLASGLVAKQIFGNTTEPTTDTEGTIQYEMAWAQDGVQFDDDGLGWSVETELGYTVHVETGYLVSYSVQLVECDDHTHNETSWLSDLFMPNTAYAGHGGEIDPSLIGQPIVENLARPTDFSYGEVTAPSINYCQGHYLVARAYETAQNLPEDVDMQGTSVYLSGTYLALDSDTPQVFTIQTNLANGALTDLVYNGHTAHVAIGENIAQIRVVRELGSLFDTVNFAEMDADAQSQAVLWQLIATTRFEIVAGAVHI